MDRAWWQKHISDESSNATKVIHARGKILLIRAMVHPEKG